MGKLVATVVCSLEDSQACRDPEFDIFSGEVPQRLQAYFHFASYFVLLVARLHCVVEYDSCSQCHSYLVQTNVEDSNSPADLYRSSNRNNAYTTPKYVQLCRRRWHSLVDVFSLKQHIRMIYVHPSFDPQTYTALCAQT
mmetsp:Transcript_47632/g.99673  ORF Transcript_47632/g.99673 Transcript_47632/m.99673 type:complete len:139 (+) Transcript_47632:152-568(+)